MDPNPEDVAADITTVQPEGIFYVTEILPLEPEDDIDIPEGEQEQLDDTTEDEEKFTYQLEPSVVVKPNEISSVAEIVLQEHLRDVAYESPEQIRPILLKVSAKVREEVRNMNLDRYKIVCQVSVGEKCDQDVAMNFLCLWKHEFDHYAVATYEGSNFFATALVFVVYKL